MPAYLLVPEGKGPFLLFCFCMITVGFYYWKKMVRPFGSPEIVMKDADNWAVGCYDGTICRRLSGRERIRCIGSRCFVLGERGSEKSMHVTTQRRLVCQFVTNRNVVGGGLIALG